MIGDKLSHFRIVAKIGEGGMGVVYRAEDENLGREVALKVLQPEAVGNEERRLRFMREARSAAAVSHPHIATVHEVDEVDGVIFIAMELVEGKTLGELIDGKPLPRRDALRYAIEVAEALTRAHAAGVIHRDLKPDNVIVTPDRHIKILDFGLAKVTDPAAPTEEAARMQTISAEMTKDGKILGTAGHMSPEQARGLAVDARSDVFSFGILLYEMITGVLPFQGATATDTLAAIVRDAPVPVMHHQPDAPLELERIVAKCLEKNRRDRYQHADEIVVDLRKLRRETDSQPMTRVSGPAEAVPRSRPKWLIPALFAMGAGTVVIVIAALLFTGAFRSGGFLPFSGGGVRSLAVLPLANLKDGNDPERLGQILQELIITDLSELEALTVLSSQRLFDIQAQLGRKDSRELDRELASEIASRAGAATMLTGSLSKLGDRWILACQLVNVADGAVIKSERIDGTDLYSMVDELTTQIRDDLGLGTTALRDVGLAVADKTTSSIEAYQHYLGGVERLNERNYEEAVHELHRAVSIDPEFGRAYYKLAVAGWWYAPGKEWWVEHDIPSPEESLKRLMSDEVKAPSKDRRLADAMMPLVKREYDDARAPFARLVEQYPDEKEAWYGLGEAEYHGQNGTNAAAREAFEKALELDPSFLLAYTHLFDIYGEQRAYDEGVAKARELIEADPETSTWYTEWVDMSIRKGNGDDAGPALEEALRHVADNDARRRLLHDAGHAFQSVGQSDRKLECFKRALEIDSEALQPRLLADVGWHHFDRLNRDRAMRYFLDAHEADPENRSGTFGIFRIYDERRSYGDAILKFRGLIKNDPEVGFLYEYWMRAAVLRGDDDEAARALEAALEHCDDDEDRADVYVEASRSYENIGDLTRAVELADKALEIAPEHEAARVRRGWVSFSGRDYEGALERFAAVHEADPGNNAAAVGLLQTRLALGRHDEALEVAERWRRSDPGKEWWYDDYLRTLVGIGRLEEAESFYESSLASLRSERSRRFFIRDAMTIYRDAGDLVRAEQLGRLAVEMEPETPVPEVFYDLGRTLGLQKRYDEAEAVHARALELFPQNALNRVGRARVELGRGDPSAAERTAREVLSRGPHGVASRLLGYALAEQGKFGEAVKVARELASRSPIREHQALLAWVLIAGDLDLDEGVSVAKKALGLRASPHASVYAESYAPSARHALGLAYLKQGDHEEAVATLEAAAAARPDRKSTRKDLERARAARP